MTLIIYACLKRKYPRNGNPKMELKKKSFPNVVHSLKKDHERKLMGEPKFCPQILDAKIDFHADDEGLFGRFGKCHFMTPWNVL